MKALFAVLLSGSSVLPLAHSLSNTTHTLTILFTGDVRGRALPIDGWDQECPFEPKADSPFSNCIGSNSQFCEIADSYCSSNGICKPCSGGIAARVKYFEQVFEENPLTITLDVANYYFGSLWSFYYKGTASLSMLNDALWADNQGIDSRPLYDAMGLSAADLFRGPAAMVSVRSMSPVPSVSSNLDWGAEASMEDCINSAGEKCFRPYVVIERESFKIGIIALTEEKLSIKSSPGEHLTMRKNGDSILALTQTLYSLRESHSGVDVILVMSALDSRTENIEVAQKVEGITAILCLQRDSTIDYEVVSNLISGHAVIISYSETLGRSVNRLDLTLDGAGRWERGQPWQASTVELAYEFYDNGTSNADAIQDQYTWNFVKAQLGNSNARSETSLFSLTQHIDGRRGPVNFDISTCRNPVSVYAPATACEASQGSTIKAWADAQVLSDLGIQDLCCPLSDSEGQCTESCDPVFDAQLDRWTYPSSSSGTLDVCCAGLPKLPCCPFAGVWESQGCRHSACPMGHLVTDAIMDLCDDCDLAVMNSGGIRASLGADTGATNVSHADVLAVLPFQNTAFSVRVPANVLVSIFQHAVSQYDPHDGDGKFLQVSGARYAFHPGAGELASLEVCSEWSRGSASCAGSWKDVAKERGRLYKVGLNNFLGSGGDGYSMLEQGGGTGELYDAYDTGVMLDQALVEYMSGSGKTVRYAGTDQLASECNGFQEGAAAGFIARPGCRVLKAPTQGVLQCSHAGASTCAEIESGNFSRLAAASGVLERQWGEDILSRIQFPRNGSCDECGGFGVCPEDGFECACQPSLLRGFEFPRQYVVDVSSAIEVCLGLARGTNAPQIAQGILMARGEGCEEVRTLFTLDYTSRALITAGAVVCVVVGIGASCWYVVHKSHAVIRASQPEFLHVTNLGGVVGGLLVLLIQSPPTQFTCQAMPLVFVTWFSLLITPLLIKSHLLVRIFRRRTFKSYKKNTLRNVVLIGVVVCGQITAILLVQMQWPMHPTVMAVSEGVSSWSFAVICDSRSNTGTSNLNIWLLALGTGNSILIILALYYALRTRSVSSAFNESKHLGLAVYSTTIVTVTSIPPMFVIADNPIFVALLRAFAVFTITLSTVLIIFIPKFSLLGQVAPDTTLIQLANNTAALGSGVVTSKQTGRLESSSIKASSASEVRTMVTALERFNVDKLLSSIADRTLADQKDQVEKWIGCVTTILHDLRSTQQMFTDHTTKDVLHSEENVRLPESVPPVTSQ